jgi:predicted porin
MQKKLIALAVAAAFSAPAFADVTAYGVVDAAVVHVSADGQKSDTLAVSGGLATSRFGVKTVEDLNNGMKAVVVLEYALDSETNASVGADAGTLGGLGFKARQQMLAVAGDFGTFATGFLQTTGYDFAVKFDPTAGSSVSPLQSMTKATNLVGSVTAGARAPRALAYISPDLGGVTVAVNYTTDLSGGLGNLTQATGTPDTKVTAWLLSATYTGGPLSVGGVYAKTTQPSAASAYEMKEYALGASYDFGVVKLLGTYQNNKADLVAFGDNFSSKVMSLSVVAPVGPGAVVATYAKNKLAYSGLSGGANGYTLAWLQPLSKLTTAYVAIEKTSNNSNTRLVTVDNNAVLAASMPYGGSSTMLAVGLNKKF